MPERRWQPPHSVANLSAYGRAFSDQDNQSAFPRLESSDDADVVSEFQRRLQNYDGVRRRLDATLPAAAVSDDLATIRRVVDAHHGALLSARFEARQGDIFSVKSPRRFAAASATRFTA